MSTPRFLLSLAGLGAALAFVLVLAWAVVGPGRPSFAPVLIAAAEADPVPKARIPFLFRNNHILLRATVGDSDSLWFILDTGAGGDVINWSTAKRLGLNVTAGSTARGAGGDVEAGIIHGASIRLPGVTLDEPQTAISLDQLAVRTGHPCDGVIGRPFWMKSVVEIDYARGELVLYEPGKWRGKGTEFPLTFEQGHPYVKARATLPGGKAVEGRFILDTGSAGALILSPSVVEKEQASLARAPRTLEMAAGGVGGRSWTRMARIEKLELGPYAMERPLAILRQEGPGDISAPGTLGNIGGDILRRFKVVFDYTGKRMILEPAAAFGEPFEADMSGLVLTPRDDGSGVVEVLIVQQDSPASELGIQVGDVLVSCDGRPITSGTMVELRRVFREEGRSVRLAVRRDSEVLEHTLVTRRLI